MPRIIELTPTALRSYGGNYDEYQRQREAEQQAARAALEHAVPNGDAPARECKRSMTPPAALGSDAAYR
jgi:ATPase subunit of ABC transporter with duplicated ATPase domains